jgi:exosome complex exonuclease RRP6
VAPQSPSKLKKHQSLVNPFRTQNIVKPQVGFLNKPDNTAVTPWKPILTSKPHATISLAQSLGTFTGELQHLQYDYTMFLPLLLYDPACQNPEGLSKQQRRSVAHKTRRFSPLGSSSTTNGQFRYKHPYETEILELQYPDTVYHKADPIPSQDVELTKATFVDTFEGVLEMLAVLRTAKEIAVDLEHHDARSYVGLVSLMQISTRGENWIIDTLKPWRQDLQILNEVFADPKIIKVTTARLLFKKNADGAGLSRSIHGHSMVAEGPWSICCWPIRYSPCIQSARIPRGQPSIPAEKICQLRC